MFSYVLLVGWARRRTRGGQPSEARGGLLTTAATTTRTSFRWASGGTCTSCPLPASHQGPSTRRPTPVFVQRGQGHPDPTTLSPRARRAGGRAGSRRRRRAARGSLGLPLLLRGHFPCSQAGNKGGWLPLRSLLSNDEGSCKRPKAVLSPLAEANFLLAYLTRLLSVL